MPWCAPRGSSRSSSSPVARRPPSPRRAPVPAVSGADPLASCAADSGEEGNPFFGTAVEPFLAVDPTDESHLVATWQQDGWNNGGAHGIVAAVSTDGGAS